MYLCKKVFFAIICNYLFMYFVKNIFIIISSMDKCASKLKMIKQKNLGYKKFKIIEIYLAFILFINL